MQKVIHKLSLDIIKTDPQQEATLRQGEGLSHEFHISFKQGGKPYVIEKGCSVILRAVKPDMTKVFNYCEVEDGIAVYTLTNQTTAASGMIDAQVEIVGPEGEVLYSPAFEIYVEKTVDTDGAMESGNELTLITEAVRQMGALRDEAQTLNETTSVMVEDIKGNVVMTEESAKEAAESAALAGREAEKAAGYAELAETEALSSQMSAAASEESALNAAASEAASGEVLEKVKDTEQRIESTAADINALHEEAKDFAANAKSSEQNAAASESIAATYAVETRQQAEAAALSTETAGSEAERAKEYARTACQGMEDVVRYAQEAESYAHGGTGCRENEDIDNARNYYEQTVRISEGLQGALIPMGTIIFSQLSTATKKPGYMYDISDDFTSDETFKNGAGYNYPAGTNVYYTTDGYWDCMPGPMVIGVKGNAEQDYRRGYISISKDNIGLGNVDNTSDTDKPVSIAQQNAIDLAYANSNAYTDAKIADLINGAPTTLDTLGEIASAMAENQSVVEALDDAIGKKANQAEVDTHTSNDTIHITTPERNSWNGAAAHANSPHITGVKGNAETTYRTGNVNLTPTDIGAVNKTGDTINGSLLVTENIESGREFVSRNANGLRLTNGYGFIIRNDGVATHLLLTDQGDATGAFNALRPLSIDNQTGALKLGSLTGSIIAAKKGLNIGDTENPFYKVVATNYEVSDKHELYNSGTTLILGVDSGGATVRSMADINTFMPITASAFQQNSSRLIKENICPMTDEEAAKILDVEVVSFDYKEKYGGQKDQRGVIAEDVSKIIPSAVSMPDDFTGEINEGGTNIPSVDYSKFVPYLIKMLQRQQAEISALEERFREVDT